MRGVMTHIAGDEHCFASQGCGKEHRISLVGDNDRPWDGRDGQSASLNYLENCLNCLGAYLQFPALQDVNVLDEYFVAVDDLDQAVRHEIDDQARRTAGRQQSGEDDVRIQDETVQWRPVLLLAPSAPFDSWR